jgi:four helix bundle protein
MIQAVHKRWELYQQALFLAKAVYRLTEAFPQTERAVLTYTLRRLTTQLCQYIALVPVKRGKKKITVLQDCLDTCIALDTQLELAITVNLTTTEATQEAEQCLEAVYKVVASLLQAHETS